VIPAFHRRGGGDTTLVCHPGGPGFSSRFFGDVAGLDADFDVVLVDPRGTGDTPRPDDPTAYRIDDYVEDVEELRAHLGLEHLNLLGWSHGGVVAMSYAAKYPARVAKLILVGTLARSGPELEAAMHAAMEKHSGEPWFPAAAAAIATEETGEFTDEQLGELGRQMFPLYFARFGDPERAFLERVYENGNGDALRLWEKEIWSTFDLRPDLGAIDAPTLVLVGAEDFICGPACACDIAEGIPHAQVVTFPETGHFLLFEAPDRFRDEVRRFLLT
jgi:proline iminopeptidase